MSGIRAIAPIPVEADRLEPATPVMVIDARRALRLVDLRELWSYRELMCFLAWRDVKVRYRETLLGGLWAILQPVAMMIAFSLFFGRMAQLPSAGLPYPLFVLAGLLPWMFFSGAISAASQSIVTSQTLVTKIYFPRLLIPFATVGVGLLDFVIAFGVLVAVMFFYGVQAGPQIVLLPVIMLALVIAAVGIGTMLSALNVAYRDFRYIIPFLMQFWLFMTPSVYMQADTGVSRGWALVLLIVNPPLGLIANFRSALVGGAVDGVALAASSGASVALFVVGCWYFRRVERGFADIV